jgi:DNA-binding transcriptional LysR family regulator
MDLSKLEFFFAAANSENFTQAAEKCNIAQTTMSKYIAQLEDELGVKLFYRTTRECSLTEAGHTFYNGAKELSKDYDNLKRHVRKASGDDLNIGIYGEFFDLTILEKFRAAHPDIRMRVSFGTKDELYDRLFRRKIHAILIPDILALGIPRKNSLRKVEILSGAPCLYCSKTALEQYGTLQNVVRELPYITKATESSYHEYCSRIIDESIGTTFRKITTVESIAKQRLLLDLAQGFAIMLKKEAPEDKSNLYEYSLEGKFNETLELHYSAKHVTDSLNKFIKYIETEKIFV